MAMAVGRSCSSYGVHLRAYLPSPSISSQLLGSFVRLNISFSAASSCRRLEFDVFPSSIPRLSLCIHSEAERTAAAPRSRQLPAKKRGSASREEELGAGEQARVPLIEAEQSGRSSAAPSPSLRRLSAPKKRASSSSSSSANPLPTKKRASSLKREINTVEEERISSVDAEQSGSSPLLRQLPLKGPLEEGFRTGEHEEDVSHVEAEQSGSTSTRSSLGSQRRLSAKKRASSLREKLDSDDKVPISVIGTEQSDARSTGSASRKQHLPAKMQASPLEKPSSDKGEQGHFSLVAEHQNSATATSSAFFLQQPPSETQASSLEKEIDTGMGGNVFSVEVEQRHHSSICSGPCDQQRPTKEQGSLSKKVLNTSKKVNSRAAKAKKEVINSNCSESRLPQISAKKQASSSENDFGRIEESSISVVEAEEADGNSIYSPSGLQLQSADKRCTSLEMEHNAGEDIHVSPAEEVSNVQGRSLDKVTIREGMSQKTHVEVLRRQGRVSFSNVTPLANENGEPDNQHCAGQTEGITYSRGEHVVQRYETNYKQQFTMRAQKADVQEGDILANFDRAHGRERKKRKEFLVRNVIANQASTISYMQILGTGFDTGETVPTVLLFFDRRRFLFNVGEGLHRFCAEHKFKLSKIDHVFLTRVCSETVGGLPGLVLTLAEMNESGLTVRTWGPSSLDDLAQAMRVFLPSGWMEYTNTFGPRKNDNTILKPCSPSPILLLEDELIKISAVLLSSENTADIKPHSNSQLDKKNGSVLATVYVCELSTVRGKFDPDKARAKGLRPGYKYGKLQRGESVLSDDGTTMVHPEDVLGSSSPGPILFVVDCPSTSYIKALTSSTSLQSFFSESGKIVNCMIHIGPTSVTGSKVYQSWMEHFKEAHHIMARPDMNNLGMPTLASSARTLSKLNLVCPWLFPATKVDDQDNQEDKESAGGLIVQGVNLLKYRLRPLSDLGPDISEVPEVLDNTTAQENLNRFSPEVVKARDMALQVWKRWSEEKSSTASLKGRAKKNSQGLPACLQEMSREEMELVFLGTGSSQPSKHRNVTGIYIHLFEKGGVLLDCGEGTLAQLKRRYGGQGADEVLLGLKCIWISHLHADHFAGILRILCARRDLLEAQTTDQLILVIGPRKLKSFLDAYGKIEDLAMEFLDCSQTTSEVQRWVERENAGDNSAQHKEGLIDGSARVALRRSGMQHIWKQPGYHVQHGIDVEGRMRLASVLDLLGLKSLYSVPVIHCPNAFAIALEAQERKLNKRKSKPGWKLVFSGDTRPCQALVEAAYKATILIHEATFEDDLVAEAVKKNHSITQEAINIGVNADVYRIFLTHFSQRYPTIPSFDSRFSDRACMAFDMMSVNLADLPLVPEFLPALQTLFKDTSDVEDEEVEGAHVLSV